MNLVRYARRWIRKRGNQEKTKGRGPEFQAFAEEHFDAAFYHAANPDVARAGLDAFTHWIKHGLLEEREFSRNLSARLVPGSAARNPELTYVKFAEKFLEVRNRHGLPAAVLDQIRTQAEHEPVIYGPGAFALPNLPIHKVGQVPIDLDGLGSCIDAKPRTIFVIPLLVIGGGEKYAADICRVLQGSRAGTVAVIVTDQNEKDAAGWRELAVVEPFRDLKVLFWRDLCSNHADPQMLASFLAYLAPETIVVTYSGICLRAIALHGKRLSQKSKMFCTYFHSGKDGLRAPYAVTLARFTTPFATSLTDNRRAARVLDNRFEALGRAAAVIPPRVEITSKDTFERKLSGRKWLPGESGKCAWLWVSRVDRSKGLDVLQHLARLRPTDTFNLFGPLAAPWDQLGLHSPNINYRGVLKEVARADFSAYQGFIFTSPHEGMPNVVLEMTQHAMPLIISDAGGLPETFGDTSAIIVPTQELVAATALAFHKACDQLAAMQVVQRRAMVTRAYEAVAQRHSPEYFEARVRDVFGI